MSLRKILRRNPLLWRYGFNIAPTLAYNLQGPSSTEEMSRIVKDLNRSGIALTTVDRLLANPGMFSTLVSEVEALERENAEELETTRRHANAPLTKEKKPFLVQLLTSRPELDPTSIFARFALESGALEVANRYFGMFTRLREYNVWHNFPVSGAPQSSQLWHRDREDRMILKMFVYLSDVDDTAGPFAYAPGTHAKGPVRREPAYSIEGGVKRTTDKQMSGVVAADRWIKATASRGTIIFADTAGFHKGGYCSGKERVMYVGMFTSPASESKELFRRDRLEIVSGTTAVKVALQPGRRGPWLSL
jgi:hypothetical protein